MIRNSSDPTVKLQPEGSFKVSVLNGSRQLDQVQRGEWVTLKVLPEAGLPRGVYQLNSAVQPDTTAKAQEYSGQVLHVDSRSVYQLHGKGIVRHDRSVFRELEAKGEQPVVGATYAIAYANGIGAVRAKGAAEVAKPVQAKDRGGVSL
ncbi:TPA: KfrB domain-containing protein [Escherichia coli]